MIRGMQLMQLCARIDLASAWSLARLVLLREYACHLGMMPSEDWALPLGKVSRLGLRKPAEEALRQQKSCHRTFGAVLAQISRQQMYRCHLERGQQLACFAESDHPPAASCPPLDHPAQGKAFDAAEVELCHHAVASRALPWTWLPVPQTGSVLLASPDVRTDSHQM